jgi:hypothetical protein
VDRRRLIAAWMFGVVCGIGSVLIGGAEYRAIPEHHEMPDIIAAQNRGWIFTRFPEGCVPTASTRCAGAMYKRPRALFFMGAP